MCTAARQGARLLKVAYVTMEYRLSARTWTNVQKLCSANQRHDKTGRVAVGKKLPLNWKKVFGKLRRFRGRPTMCLV